MNKFELHEKAQLLADTCTSYNLARRVIELESVLLEFHEKLSYMLEKDAIKYVTDGRNLNKLLNQTKEVLL